MSPLPTSLQMVTGAQIGDIMNFFLFRKLYPNKTLTLSELWDAVESDVAEGQSFRIFRHQLHLAGWLGISVSWGRTLTITGLPENPVYSLTDKGREYVEEEAERQGISLKEMQGIDGLTLETMTFVAHVVKHGPIQLQNLVSLLKKISQGAGLPLINAQTVCNAIQPAINAGLITAVHKNKGGSEFSITPSGTETLKRWIEMCHADGFLFEVPVPA